MDNMLEICFRRKDSNRKSGKIRYQWRKIEMIAKFFDELVSTWDEYNVYNKDIVCNILDNAQVTEKIRRKEDVEQ